jgi:hypothetical protein
VDPVCRGGSDRHLAGYLDVENIGYQRFVNQARKLCGTARLLKKRRLTTPCGRGSENGR